RQHSTLFPYTTLFRTEELTNAYSVVPNKGVFRDAYMIDKIEDAEGNIIYQHADTPVTVYSEQTAYLMADMLRTVVSNGTGSLVKDRKSTRLNSSHVKI